MKLVWHIVAKDLRRHQLPYGLWLCLLLAKQAVLVLAFSDWSVDAEWFEHLQTGDMVLSVVESVVAFLLVGGWVLEDPLVGSTQFWVTRPVSGRRLLGAKALGVALLFVAVPLVVAGTGWLACGLTGTELGQQAIIFLSVQMALVAIAFVIGALSDRGSRFLLLLLGVAVAVFVLTPLVPKLFTVYPETRALAATRVVVGLALIGAAMMGAIWLQYVPRRALAGAAWLLGGVALGIAAWNQFPIELHRGWRHLPEPLAEAQGVQLEIRGVRPAQPTTYQKTPSGKRWVDVICAVQNVPAHLRLSVSYGRLVFTAADGQRHEAERVLTATQGGFEEEVRAALEVRPYAFANDAETVAHLPAKVEEPERRWDDIQKDLAAGKLSPNQAAEQLRVLKPVIGGREMPTLTAHLLVPDWLVAQLTTGTVSMEVQADVKFARLRRRGEASLDEPGSWCMDGFRARVVGDALVHHPGRSVLDVTIVSTRTAAQTRPHYYVLNREIGYVSAPASKRSKGPLPVPTFAAVRFGINEALPRIWRDGGWSVAPRVEHGLTLAALTIDEVGLVRRSAQRTNVPWGVQLK